MKTASAKKLSKPKIRRVGIGGLRKKLASFEIKYNMPTEVFLQKVEKGEMEDTHDVIRWLGAAEAYQAINKSPSNDA